MATTPLVQKFGLHAVAGEYAGAETVLNFGSPAYELAALRNGCGVFDLGWRGKLVLSGEDRVRWLNGMVSNNTRDLVQDSGNYNLVLNAQGRIQGDLMVFQLQIAKHVDAVPLTRRYTFEGALVDGRPAIAAE